MGKIKKGILYDLNITLRNLYNYFFPVEIKNPTNLEKVFERIENESVATKDEAFRIFYLTFSISTDEQTKAAEIIIEQSNKGYSERMIIDSIITERDRLFKEDYINELAIVMKSNKSH